MCRFLITNLPACGIAWAAVLLLGGGCRGAPAAPAASTAPGTALAGARPRHVLLVTIDTLRADHVSAYGYGRRTTPGLDAFMSRGTRYEHAFSATSFTVPSHVAMLTGLDPSFTSTGLENGAKWALDESVTTLAEVARNAGFFTAAVVSSHTLLHKVGLDQGFDVYDDDIRTRGARGKQPADVSCDEMLALLDRAGTRPFFAWLHLMDPHGPYYPPPGWPARFTGDALARSGRGRLSLGRDDSGYRSIPRYQAYNKSADYDDYVWRYDNMIAVADAQLARLFSELERRGRLAETLVVVTADHGEALGEDDYYFAHSHSVGLEQVRVPLAFVGPGIAGGRVLSGPVSNIDVFATICELMGWPGESGRHSRGLAAELSGGSGAPRRAFCASWSQRGAAAGDLYLRRDRRPAGDAGFWSRRNPNNNTVPRPLGTRLVRLSDGSVRPESEGADLGARLDAFGAEADAALDALPRNRLVNRSRAEKADLRALGYVTGEEQNDAEPGAGGDRPSGG